MGFRKLRWQGERWRAGTIRRGHCSLRKNIFMTFSLSSRNIHLYFSDKSKWLLLFLVKNWVSVIFGVMPFVSLQELGLHSPAGPCLCSDQTPPQYLASEELWPVSCRKYYLKLNSDPGDTLATQFTTDFVGMERVTSKVFLKSKSNRSIPQLLSSSA